MTPASSESPFNFEDHASKAVEQYKALRGVYETFANIVRSVLRHAIPLEDQIQSIEARAKDPKSFGAKASQPLDSDPSAPKYSEPLKEITDLAGVRVIVFFPKTLSRVNEVIMREFDVRERTDKAEELIADDKFGYQSIHYLVKLKGNRSQLPEYSACKDLVAEIQLRTILQHAWAEMEHDIQYKSPAAMPPTIRRRFMSLAGMLEIADREFQAVQDEDESVRMQVREDAELPDLPPDVKTGERPSAARLPSTSYLTGSARALLEKGRYLDAVRAYDSVISKHPRVYTNYLGRARARFLAGDRNGAVQDLAMAEGLVPNDPMVGRLREQIGESQILPSFSPLPGQDHVHEGNRLLASGDSASALAEYSKAETDGWLSIYSKINRAMALLLSKEPNEALVLLNEARPIPGSFVEVNVLALRVLCYIQTAKSPQLIDNEVQALKGLVLRVDFSYFKSPLRYVEDGLRIGKEIGKYSSVFLTLKKEAFPMEVGKPTAECEFGSEHPYPSIL